MSNRWRIGFDIGGTFTDFILYDSQERSVRLHKRLTTPHDPSEAALIGLGELVEMAGITLADVGDIVHGTTLVTNAVIERKGSKLGLITTKGFRDILEMGTEQRYDIYDLFLTFPDPLVSREHRLEVAERMDRDGQVVTALDADAVRKAARELEAAGCEAIAICFLHSYLDDAQERRAAEIVREVAPDAYVSTSSGVLPEFREYERFSTTVINAYVGPRMDRYLDRFLGRLEALGIPTQPYTIHSNGGLMSVETVRDNPVRTCLSGPAAGVVGAAEVGRQAGLPNLITFDVGGTSTDVSLVEAGAPAFAASRMVADHPVRTPMVDIHVIGAGGGSIAWLDDAGALKVGPHSAGADPGPVAYGRGGTEPTLTDANLVLGRLAPKKLLAVENPATVERVAAVFEEKIGRAAGLSAVDAAGAVLRLGNMKMAGAIRMVSIGRGHDPRDFALFAFGGAGPLHASALARELGLPKVLVPARPGITNALGCVVADMRHDFVNTVNQPVAGIDEARMLAILQDHEAQGRALIAQEAVEPSEIRVTHSADMQFVGQTHIVNVPLPAAGISRATLQTLFEKAYFARFKVELPEIRANLVNLNTSVTGVRHQVDLSRLIDPDGRAATLEGALLETRPVWFSGTWHDTPVYAREKLPLAAAVAGPAILEQMDATTVLEPGDMARGDADGNIVIEVGT